MVLIEFHPVLGEDDGLLPMHHLALYSLVLFLLILPVLIGLWRGFARARRVKAGVAERNPGPDGSYVLIGWSLRHMPGWFNRAGMDVGTWIAWATLPRQRECSREYLRLALGHEPTTREVWKHFRAYTEYLGGRAHMVRKKVGNSDDIDRLASRYAGSVAFIWINDWSRLILAMNDALRSGCSLAMQCDRFEYSSKREGFEFFGRRLLFPFTIYHLAIMHGLPVTLSYAVSTDDDPEAIVVHTPPMFHPREGHEHRRENFAAAHEHFQGFLTMIEAQLRCTPYLWFNFTPLNPVCPEALPTPRRAGRTMLASGAVDLSSVV